jgi:predicted CxxxxCH...CXXCH cytochrome family protein
MHDRSTGTVRRWLAGCGVLFVVACGEAWSPAEHDESRFPLECGHAGVACESCHAPDEPLEAADDRCVNCHVEVRPASHDPDTTATCDDCHSTCAWDELIGGNPHPDDYERPELHGVESNLQVLDCTSCHGDDWTGGSAQGCDDCHTASGHGDWRTDCTYCHGGADGDTEGMPPEDLDDESDADAISFRAHPEHADPGGVGHPAYGCATCHEVYTAALDPGHATDATAGRSEVVFGGLAAGGSYAAGSCTTWCHGDGRGTGTVTDGVDPMGCNGCHSSSAPFTTLSGTHALHLGDGDVACADCHAPVVEGSDTIVSPDEHVDGTLHVDLASTGWDPGGATCTVRCHGHEHAGTPWVGGGHPPGYDAPEAHGTDSLVGASACNSCHGADLQGGGSGVGCDDCHQAGWRTDCTYCHGGEDGDTDGLPPQDLDNQTNEAASTFDAHREHGDAIGHPDYACSVCHPSEGYADALLDVGHWFDGTPGVAEVSFDGSPQPGGTYSGTTCSNIYCHGDGRGTGTVSDGSTPMACDSCHPGTNGWNDLSGEHERHEERSDGCQECHKGVVDPSDAITGDALHVDGDVDIDMTGSGITWNGTTCSGGQCHGEEHSHNGDDW